MIIAVVGVCASGKSTLVKGLRGAGFNAYTVAQEHSCIKTFWDKHKPDCLIFLDAALPVIERRRHVRWRQDRLDIQHERLEDARANADLYVQTDSFSEEEVLQKVIAFLRRDTDVEAYAQ